MVYFAMNILHITVRHRWWDNRIYKKYVLGLIGRGFSVGYVAPLLDDECVSDLDSRINFIPIKAPIGIVNRLSNLISVALICLKHRKHIIHFHDPELVPLMILLRLLCPHIVYDVHEDFVLYAKLKFADKNIRRHLIVKAVASIEAISAKLFSIYIAESSYKSRFPNAIQVLNYADCDNLLREKHLSSELTIPAINSKVRLIYTGSISFDRGLLNHIQLLKYLHDAHLVLAGRFDKNSLNYISTLPDDIKSKLTIIGGPDGISFENIVSIYTAIDWHWGLALFDRSEHYEGKLLTKFYEYAAYGIPILCTDFQLWSEFINGNGFGVAVPVENGIEAVNAITKNRNNFDRTKIATTLLKKFTWSSQLDNAIKHYKIISI